VQTGRAIMSIRAGTVLFEYDHTDEARGPRWDEDSARYIHNGDAGYKRWTVESAMWSPEFECWSYIIESDGFRAAVNGENLREAVGNEDNNAWVPSMYDGEEGKWIIHPRRANPEDVTLDDRKEVRLRLAPKTPSDLSFEMIQRDGSRKAVNAFLEGADDGLVHHELGSVHKWKRAFVARYHGAVISVLVLHFYNPAANGHEPAITRLANHESAPPNTSSWMIGKARDWAERYGYHQMATYTGVGKNGGTCYKAAGFEPSGDPAVRDATNWDRGDKESKASHPSVTIADLVAEIPEAEEPEDLKEIQQTTISATLDELAADGQTLWLRQKYVDELSPGKYDSKGPEWARRTVCDDTHVPEQDGERVLQCEATAH